MCLSAVAFDWCYRRREREREREQGMQWKMNDLKGWLENSKDRSTILYLSDKRRDQNTMNVDPGADGNCEWGDGWRAALEECNKIERNNLRELLLGKGPQEPAGEERRVGWRGWRKTQEDFQKKLSEQNESFQKMLRKLFMEWLMGGQTAQVRVEKERGLEEKLLRWRHKRRSPKTRRCSICLNIKDKNLNCW